MDNTDWYSIRCVFCHVNGNERLYEERLTVWRAASFNEAIVKAENEAREYAQIIHGQYLGFAQAYIIGEEPISEGSEVFSLTRASGLASGDYITRYFDTGRERQHRNED